jgi:hypothetical protein
MTHTLDNLIGDSVNGVLGSALDEAMKGVWEAATGLMTSAFSVVDSFSTFTVDAHSGPVGAIWPTLLTVSTAIALGLFFWQLTLASLRGGKGMMRAATGPFAYGIALAITVTGIAAALACADALTSLILSSGLNVTTFARAFTHTSVLGQVGNEAKAVALGLIGVFGVFPAALGWVLEIIWRQATILVLVATVPITAAGLLANSTASWFWRGLRWTIAAITVKPVLALVVVIGMSSLAGATGPAGVLAGVAVLWVALISPMALFRLLAFVDPDTASGQAFRDSFSQLSSRFSGSGDSGGAGSGSGGGSGSDSGGMGALESANTARFDAAAGAGSESGSESGTSGAPAPAPAGNSDTGAGTSAGESTSGSAGADNSGSHPGSGTNSGSGTGSGSGSSSGSDSGAGDGGMTDGGMTDGGQPPVSAAGAPPADTGPAHPPAHPRPPAGGPGPGSGGGSGSGGAAAGEEVAEAAVIL